MRLVIARCTVDYEGRLAAHLPSATRLVMVKADGCIAIHADDRAYKPLNWMNAPCRLVEGPGADGAAASWIVTGGKGERLTITMEEVLSDTSHDLGFDPGLVKDGVEAELQALLADNVHVLGPGLTLLRREHLTDIGPVDLLCRHADGGTVAVEVKRRGEIDGVEQVARYVERLARDARLTPVRGLLAAQVVRPQARVLAAARGIAWVEVDYDALRGMERAAPTLF